MSGAERPVGENLPPESTDAGRRLAWTAGHLAAAACQLEAAIPKPGNVHRRADFSDMSLYDMLWSGQIVGQIIDDCAREPLGTTILTAVRCIHRELGKNTHLGTVLLLCPLAKLYQCGLPWDPEAMASILQGLTDRDAADIYTAIRLAAPAGLGRAPRYDVADPPPRDILDAMREAAHRDAVARQWATAFHEVLTWWAPRLAARRREYDSLERAVLAVHVEGIAHHGDSHIARQWGQAVEQHARQWADQAMTALSIGWEAFDVAAAELDHWMRQKGQRRNPGTTADLIAAALFVGFARGELAI